MDDPIRVGPDCPHGLYSIDCEECLRREVARKAYRLASGAEAHERLAMVTKQRDDLLEAAKEVVACPYDDTDRWEDAFSALDMAIADVIEAKGKE